MSEYELDGMRLPRFAKTAADAVADQDHARAILAAYYRPEIRHGGDPRRPGREIRIAGGVHIVVCDDTIIAVSRHDPPAPDGPSAVLGPVESRRNYRRGRGGGGTRIPTTVAELIERARALGAVVERSQRHYLVSIPGGPQRLPVPANPRDWRSLRNSVAVLKRAGLDVSRDSRSRGSG